MMEGDSLEPHSAYNYFGIGDNGDGARGQYQLMDSMWLDLSGANLNSTLLISMIILFIMSLIFTILLDILKHIIILLYYYRNQDIRLFNPDLDEEQLRPLQLNANLRPYMEMTGFS